MSKDDKRKICVGTYNGLFASAENGLQASWKDLGLSHEGLIERSENNKEMSEMANKNGVLPPIYFVYKKNANQIVDDILKELDIEVAED